MVLPYLTVPLLPGPSYLKICVPVNGFVCISVSGKWLSPLSCSPLAPCSTSMNFILEES